MGCDGGTIPRRDELVRTKKKPEAKDKDSERIFLWKYCFITQQLLQSPIVMCGLGKLYNKISLIEALLDRAMLPEGVKHIKSLKDIKDLNLTPNPAYKHNDNADLNTQSSPYICPVIGLEMSGKFRFVALWSCGCVFSERALKEIDTKNCHKCQAPFLEDDVVILNGNEEDLAVMKLRMEKRQQKNKKNKATRVKVKVETTTDSSSTEESSTSSSTEVQENSDKKNEIKCDPEIASSSTKVQDKSDKKNCTKSDSEVPVKQAATSKVVPGSGTMNGTTKRSGSLKQPDIDTKKMKPDYSVAKDPKVSDVYKSIFTSHKSEKEQNRAHWITYNPFYN